MDEYPRQIPQSNGAPYLLSSGFSGLSGAKVLAAGSGIDLTPAGGYLVISADASSQGADPNLSYTTVNNDSASLPNSKRLTAGPNITLTPSSGNLIISSSGGTSFSILPVASGGTGAATAAGALVSLGAAASSDVAAIAWKQPVNYATAYPIALSTTTDTWQNKDVGSPSISGGASFNSSTLVLTCTGAGQYFYDTSDQGNITYRNITGDFTAVCRVKAVSSGYQQIGLMFRESTNANSANYFTCTRSLGGEVFYRSTTGGSTSEVNSITSSAGSDGWLKLTRIGNVFTGFYTPDLSRGWTQIDSRTINMTSAGIICIAISSDNTGASFTQDIDYLSINGTVSAGSGGSTTLSVKNNGQLEGATLASNDRVLVKDQIDTTTNGLYAVNMSGSWTRTTDANTAASLISGTAVTAQAGTINASTQWQLITAPPITLGSSSLTFVQLPYAIDAGLAARFRGPITLDGTTTYKKPGGVYIGENASTGEALILFKSQDQVNYQPWYLESEGSTGHFHVGSAGNDYLFINQNGGNGGFYGNGTKLIYWTQICDIDRNEQLKFGTMSSAVNEITITNAATTSAPVISSTGDDSNIGLRLAPKGTGNILLSGNASGWGATFTGGATVSGSLPTLVNSSVQLGSITDGYSNQAGCLKLIGNDGKYSTLQTRGTDGAVVLYTSVRGDYPFIIYQDHIAMGIDLSIAGSLYIATSIWDANSNEYLKFSSTSSAINEFTITNAAVGTGPTLSSTGGDSNINIKLSPKGSGIVDVDSSLISNVLTPVASGDAANKYYVDSSALPSQSGNANTLLSTDGSNASWIYGPFAGTPTTETTGTYTLSASSNCVHFCDNSGGTITYNLPAITATNINKCFVFCLSSNSNNNITLSASTGQTIGGAVQSVTFGIHKDIPVIQKGVCILAPVTSTQWRAIASYGSEPNLSDSVEGVLDTAHGGTGANTVPNAFINIVAPGGTITGTLTLQNASNTQELIVKAKSGQTANLQEWQNSSGTVLLSVNASGSIVYPIRTVTDTTSALYTDYQIRCNKATAMSVNLFASTSGLTGTVLVVKNINIGTVTVQAAGSENIDSSNFFTLSQWQSVTLINNGSGWDIT